MSENKPFASRYIETGAGTNLAIAASIRAVIGIVIFYIQLTFQETNSLLAYMVVRTMQLSTGITVGLNVLTAISLLMIRYKLKGDGLLNFVIILNLICNWAVVFSSIASYGSGRTGLNIVVLVPMLLYLIVGIYYYSCYSVLKEVRIELRQKEPTQSPYKHLLSFFCILSIAISIIDGVNTIINSEMWITVLTNLADILIYYHLYAVVKDINRHHISTVR